MLAPQWSFSWLFLPLSFSDGWGGGVNSKCFCRRQRKASMIKSSVADPDNFAPDPVSKFWILLESDLISRNFRSSLVIFIPLKLIQDITLRIKLYKNRILLYYTFFLKECCSKCPWSCGSGSAKLTKRNFIWTYFHLPIM